MASFVQSGKYGTMNTTCKSTMGYYVIKFVSEAYTLQEDITRNRKIIPDGELVSKVQYLSCMQVKTNWCWEQKKQHQVIVVLKQTIVHPCLVVVALKDVRDIPKSICNRNNTKQALRNYPIFLTDSDHGYILEET